MGHPDGQAFALWRGPDFFASSGAHIDSTHPIQTANLVTNYASLFLSCSPAFTGGVTVTVNFFTDATATILTQTFNWTIPRGVSLSCLIPIVGNFAAVSVNTGSVAGGNVQLAVLPTNAPTDAIRYLQTDNHASGLNVSILATSTQVFLLPFIGSGSGFWYIQDLASSGHIQGRLAHVDANAAEILDIDEIATVASVYRQYFVASSHPVAIFVQNTDAAAHSVNFFISIDGR